jgi:CubicO group peptidase (beta-lactamase class C family)
MHQHPDYTIDYPMHAEWPLCSGGAGLTSSTSDYATFLQMYLGRGQAKGVRVLKEATVDSVMADQAPGLISGPWQQGLAFGVKSDSAGAGRFFWSGYFNTQFYADPETQEVVVLMKQTYGLNSDTSSTAFNALLWD